MKILILISLIAGVATALARPNVLFIAVDDLRAELGCYGAEHIVSPNIDKLAASGVRFDRAYCQQAICGPSRASIMTGLRPDSVQVHGNHTHFRKTGPDIVTLPQYFKSHGYHTQSMGKLYHGVFPPGSSRTEADTFGDAPSWSVPTFRPGPRYYYTEEGVAAAKGVYERLYGGGGDWTEKLVFGPATEAPDVEDGVLYDGQVAERAVATLKELGSKRDEPFFLAVGFIKPHSPYIAPKKYWELYDEDAIELAWDAGFPDGAPAIAGHGSGELRRYTDQTKRGVIPDAAQRKVRHGYYACISYIDAQVGRVLDELERQGLDDETIVVLWSDHGYHLGEKGLWGKTTNFELDARVPLIVRAPGVAGNGKRSEALVELVDLYPTLADLAGLPVGEQLEGTSFVSLLDAPDARWKKAAFTQFTRGKRRGYSIASGDYRYVEWYEIDSVKLLARELYDHREDVEERHNLATERPGVARRLARLLDRGEGWRGVAPGAELEVAGIFGEGMVLQRGKPVPVWGVGPAGAEVRVSFGGQSVVAAVNRDGQWQAELGAMDASAVGRAMRVACGEREVVFDDVLVGEVWVCAGQSNMRWMVKQSAEGAVAKAENPQLRLIDFTGRIYPNAKRYSVAELRAGSVAGYYDTEGWRRASEETVPSFSAVAYYFGTALQRELGVPVGLVHNAIGGVPMESYLPREVMEADAELGVMLGDWMTDSNLPTWVRKRGGQNLVEWKENGVGMRPHHPFEPGFLFEAGMRPLVPMAHAGFVWYQGESNATEDGAGSPAIDPAVNRRKFGALIGGWREVWGDGGLPFYFVQLPGLNRDWAWFREMQQQVSGELENVGMVVTLDLGHPTNVHPKAKKPVGERLAAQALAKTYGRDGIDPDGPSLVGHKRVGEAVELSFDKDVHVVGGDAAVGLVVAGEDEFFHPAEAVVEGKKMLVSSGKVRAPSAVRYAWGNDPEGNLVNARGMLASPFRTDEFVFVAAKKPGIPEGTISFEGVKAGGFVELATPGGTWFAEKGHAEVNEKFAYSGRQCLHIRGGEGRQVEFVPVQREGEWGQLSFRAERWTMRKPFSFRVEAWVRGAWSEIYNGDREIRVGARFLTPVAIVVPEKAERFRLTCSAAEGGGILIDDVRLAPAKKMRVNVGQSWPVNPVLIGKADNPALKIGFDADGSLEAKKVVAIQLSAAGSDRLDDIKSVRVSVGGKAFGEPSKPGVAMSFSGEYELRDGANEFVVSIEPAEGASLDRRVKVVGTKVKLDDEVRKLEVADGDGRLRIGVALRQRGQDGSDAYRIPGLATTNDGTLIAVYDNRYRGGGDLPGDIDVGMSRSTDGGQSWEPMKVIMDMGADPEWRYDGIGDPAVLVDRLTGAIWVAATWSHGNRSWNGSGPGLEPEETGQLMLVKSLDDGLTWSGPVNITKQVKKPEWRFVLQGPGKGITMKDGTLVFPAQFRGKNEAPVGGKPFSTLVYSRDRGETWEIGTGVKIDTTEAQLVELGDGSIMINCRDNRGGSRSVYTTRDLGKTWEEPPSSRAPWPAPGSPASLIRTEGGEHRGLLIFSNPPQARGRHHMTIKVSDDEGVSWPAKWHTLIDDRSTAYSCMTLVGGDRVGLLYEGQGELYYVRVPIAELLGPGLERSPGAGSGRR